MKRLMVLLLLAAVIAPVSGCVVYPAHPRPYAAAYWAPGHFGAYGVWHPGHWA